jgi:membrane fusion protein (multidrug efflux system)
LDNPNDPEVAGIMEPEEIMADQKSPYGQEGNGIKWYQRKRVIIPFFLFIIAAVAVIVYWYTYIRGYTSTDDAYIDGNKLTISSKILSRTAQLGADEGDTVSQGELLVQLDDTDLRSQEAQAQANMNYTQQNVSLARINLQKATDDFSRADQQFKVSIITKEQYDHAKIAVEAARAQLDVAQAQVSNAQAQLNVVQTNLKNTQIIAPSRGVVARRWVMTGDIVQAGQPIFTLYDLDSVWVSAIFEETKIASLHHGSLVEIDVDAYRDTKFDGKVDLIGAAAASQFSLIPPNNASGNFTKVTQRVPVKITIDRQILQSARAKTPLLPGMSVEVRVKE